MQPYSRSRHVVPAAAVGSVLSVQKQKENPGRQGDRWTCNPPANGFSVRHITSLKGRTKGLSQDDAGRQNGGVSLEVEQLIICFKHKDKFHSKQYSEKSQALFKGLFSRFFQSAKKKIEKAPGKLSGQEEGR